MSTKKRPYTKNEDGSFTDSFGRKWKLPKNELCPVCGQPDDYSDCNHKRLTNAEVKLMGLE